MHIIDAKKAEPHPWTPAAQIIDGELSYSAGADAAARLPGL
jgi:hypothetical protein